MRARTGLSIFCLALTPFGCGARSEIRGALPDASVDADAHEGDATTSISCEQGVVQIATTASQPDTIILDGEWVYWHDATGIFRAKKSGGGTETLAQSAPYFWPDLVAFAIGGGNLFYGDGDSIVSQGATIGTLPSPGFAAGPSHVFAWSRDVLPSTLFRYAFDGTGVPTIGQINRKPEEMTFAEGEVPCIAEDPGVECNGTLLYGLSATDLVVTGKDIWFTSNDATNGARVLHLWPSFVLTTVDDTTGAFALAQDQTDLFFTDGLGLRVRRIDGKTGPVTDIAVVGPDFAPMDIVVDDTCVYWTSSSRFDKKGAGAVMAGPKK